MNPRVRFLTSNTSALLARHAVRNIAEGHKNIFKEFRASLGILISDILDLEDARERLR